MPTKKKSFVRKKKKFIRKRTMVRKRSLMSKFPIGGFPVAKVVRLRLCEEVVLNSTAIAPVGVAEYLLNGMGPSRVSGTGAGRKPTTYTKWAALYDRYTVLASKITLKYCPSATTTEQPMYYGIMMQNEADLGPAAFSTVGALLESKYAGNFKLSGGGAYGNKDTGKSNQQEIIRYYSAKKWFKEKDPNSDTDILANTIGGSQNPSNQVSAFCWAIGCGGQISSVANTFLIEIDFLVRFKEPTAINDT